MATNLAEKKEERYRPGFELGHAASRFPVGPNPREVSEHGYNKVVGDFGVFAHIPANGASFGRPNSGSPASQKPAMTRTSALHNNRVLEYFVESGMPRDQVQSVRVSTLMTSSGVASDVAAKKPEFTAFYSGVNRSLDGVPVADSMAYARFNSDDESVEEAAYWPPVPQSIVDTAQNMKSMLGDPELRSAYLAKLPISAAENGSVAIRHTSWTQMEAPQFFVSYDVVDGVGTGATIVRHFDPEGNEFRLPQETSKSNALASDPKPSPPGPKTM